MNLEIDSPLTALPGVGPKRAAALAEAGFATVGDLLRHLPARYEDRSTIHRAADAEAGAAATFRGRLTKVARVYTRRRGFSLVRGTFEDDSGTLPVLWFNRPYLANQLDTGSDTDAGTEYLLHGKVREARGGGAELLNPSVEAAERALHSGKTVAVYGGAGELGPALLRRLVGTVLEELGAENLPELVPDPLPRQLLERHRLPLLGEALAALHAPDLHARPGDADVAALNDRDTPAHQRIVYGELLAFQLALAERRAQQQRRVKPFRHRVDDRLRQVLAEVLPFRLTAAQRRALDEILADLERPVPMLRLLQGDVGCGKTIVAALALLAAVENGHQGAFMAPTELLAEQHGANLRRLLGGRCRVALLTASNPDLAVEREALAAGEADLAVGTHALIQQGTEFRRLALAVIDEQHRFGVRQRRLLQEKGERPDVLVMTATPIPRSLALTAYGDLDLSLIDELPPGRRPIETHVLPASKRRAVYRRLRDELTAGDGRAYVVCPLIEESEAVAAASVEETAGEVAAAMAPLPCGVVHGRLGAEERERVVGDFAAGRLRVLVATTVIEVGVDVPEATAMVIESGERFGLAQLHQLRGRVGRSERPSRCVVLHGRLGEEAKRRLAVFAESGDGFEIAEADLAIRGPGDLLGTRQAGLPPLHAADLVRDREWLEVARRDAREWIERETEETQEMRCASC
ncbi:MAG TPA: ATP-dependent DNA helicase RecG [Thermoanaerobaculia bacterium]|nr:ATP-dependent DNA helicase RecG [Thermoanaerobaculia bacterium]